MIDHKAEAERLADLSGATIAGMTVAEVHVSQAAAQVHATLYLAEQQKNTAGELHTANLIAYAQLLESQYRESVRHPTEYDQATKAASIKRHAETLRQIREGLGL